MLSFLAKRLLQTVLVIYLIATLVFFMMKAVPGGPFSQERNVSEYVLKKLEEQYGLNDPLLVQYGKYMVNISPKRFSPGALSRFDLKEGLGIDFGYSFRYEGRTVNQLIAESFPVSLELGLYALILATSMGVSVGALAALKQNSWLDHVPMAGVMVGICMPTFVMAPVLILIFGFWVPEPFRLPVLFWEPFHDASWWESMRHKILPALTLSLYYAAGIARLTRGSMLEVLSQDYIRTARAKGLSEFQVVAKHGLRTGLVPVVSYLGPVAAHLLTGSFIIEYLFMLPGLGRHLINAALNRDYTLIMGTVLVYAVVLILFNLLVDILLVALNPKLKLEKA